MTFVFLHRVSREPPSFCRHVIEELVRAFSCAYIELWIHLRGLESTQEAIVTLGYRLEQLFRFSLAFQNSQYMHAKHEPIDQFRYIKIQPNTIDLSTRLWGINPTNSVVIPQSLVLGSIVLG